MRSMWKENARKMIYAICKIWLLKKIPEINEFVPIVGSTSYIPLGWEKSEKKDEIRAEAFDKLVYSFLVAHKDQNSTKENTKFSIRIESLRNVNDNDFGKAETIPLSSVSIDRNGIKEMEDYCLDLYLNPGDKPEE